MKETKQNKRLEALRDTKTGVDPKKTLEIDSMAFCEHCEAVRWLVFDLIYVMGKANQKPEPGYYSKLMEILEFTYRPKKEK